MKRRVSLGVAAALATLFVGCGQAPVVEQVATYGYIEVATADTEVESRFSASIRGRQDIDIVPQVSGTISEVKVVEGERVKRGQTLFVIDQVPFKAALCH